MSGASQQFLELMNAIGKGQRAGLPAGQGIFLLNCETCRSFTDHEGAQARAGQRTVVTYTCLTCGTCTEETRG